VVQAANSSDEFWCEFCKVGIVLLDSTPDEFEVSHDSRAEAADVDMCAGNPQKFHVTLREEAANVDLGAGNLQKFHMVLEMRQLTLTFVLEIRRNLTWFWREAADSDICAGNSQKFHVTLESRELAVNKAARVSSQQWASEARGGADPVWKPSYQPGSAANRDVLTLSLCLPLVVSAFFPALFLFPLFFSPPSCPLGRFLGCCGCLVLCLCKVVLPPSVSPPPPFFLGEGGALLIRKKMMFTSC
jgi:hypothetical protein